MRDFIGDKDRSEELVSKLLNANTNDFDDVVEEANNYLRGETISFGDSYLAGILAGIEIMRFQMSNFRKEVVEWAIKIPNFGFATDGTVGYLPECGESATRTSRLSYKAMEELYDFVTLEKTKAVWLEQLAVLKQVKVVQDATKIGSGSCMGIEYQSYDELVGKWFNTAQDRIKYIDEQLEGLV